MKLAPLLAQYLYSNKILDLPGLGAFRFTPSPVPYPEEKKTNRPEAPGQISFENKVIRESPELVSYIAAKTGKIKALAAADLQSHLELVQQFLHIGKPFLLEGIGSLVKVRTGEYAFTSGEALPETLKDYSAREISSTSSTEETFSDYRNAINKNPSQKLWRKPFAAILILAGIGLAVWGGYTVYKMTADKEQKPVAGHEQKPEKQTSPETNTPPVSKPDTTTIQQDSTPPVNIPAPVMAARGTIKYILEEARARRAFERYARLKTFEWPVQMETRDSVTYTLYMVLPSSYADTTRILDSLTILNGKDVWVAK